MIDPPPIARRPLGGGRRGFTLVEMVLAIALNLVLLASIASATFIFLRGFQRADRDVTEAQVSRAIFARLGQDLRELSESPPEPAAGAEATAFETDLPPSVLRGTTRSLELLVRDEESPAATPASESTPEESPVEAAVAAPVWQVEYALAALAGGASTVAGDEPPAGFLRHRRRPSFGDAPQDPSAAEAVAVSADGVPLAVPSRDRLVVEEITDLRFRYYDGAAWRDDWDSRLDGLPRAIEAVILFARPAAKSADAAPPTLTPEAGDSAALPAGAHRLVIALGSAAPIAEEPGS